MTDLPRNRQLVLVSAALAALAVFVGCGGGSDTTSSVPATPSAASGQTGPGSTTVSKSDRMSARDESSQKRKAPKGSAAKGGADKRTKSLKGENQEGPADSIVRQVEGLVSGGAGKARVVSSGKEVRKILKELKEPAQDRESQPGDSGSVEETLEKVLGH